MFSIEDAKRNCAEIDSTLKARGWIKAANSFVGSQRIANPDIGTLQTTAKAIEFANQNYSNYSTVNPHNK